MKTLFMLFVLGCLSGIVYFALVVMVVDKMLVVAEVEAEDVIV